MFVNDIFVLIFFARSWLRWAIWLCIYSRKVSDDHRPIFLIVVSASPMSLRAIAPPARKEWTPMRSGSIPLRCKLRVCAAFRTVCNISGGVIGTHLFVSGDQTSQIKLLGPPPFERT